MWWWGLVIFLTGGAISQHLIGQNICIQEERYNVTFEKVEKKNVTVRFYVWCLGVPPRCSKYRTELKDTIKILEEERTRLIQKCCEGYTEDITNTFCVPSCSLCEHGHCVNPATCVCNPGYEGISCDQKCSTGRWGVDCQQECRCRNGACDPESGSCQCETDWTGTLCDIPVEKITEPTDTKVCQECIELDGRQSQESENTTQLSEITTEFVENSTTQREYLTEFNTTTTQKIETSTYSQTKLNDDLKEGGNMSNRTTNSEMKVRNSYEDGYLETELNKLEPTEGFKESNRSTYSEMKVRNSYEDRYVDSEMNKLEPTEGFKEMSNRSTYSEMKVKNSYDEDKLYPMDEIRSQPKINVVSGIGITIGLSVLIILVAIISVLINRYKSKRTLVKKFPESSNNNEHRTGKPVIYRSTFHAPLPDPPTFQNPVFTLVTDKTNSTNIHPSKNLPGLYNNLEESVDLQYDYPPSTGSYRAASIPDPDVEPLYDEIPSCRRPVPVLHLASHSSDLTSCHFSKDAISHKT